MRKIDCQKARRQKSAVHLLAPGRVFVGLRSSVATRELCAGRIDFTLANRGKAVIRCDKNVRVVRQSRRCFKIAHDLSQVAIRVVHGCLRSRSVNTRAEPIEAVSLVMLSAVRVA
jgi:hypothetical protein